MHHPTIFFDPAFVVNVILGWLVTVAGAGTLLLAGVWAGAAGDWLGGQPRPAAWRGLCVLGLGMFLAGLLWQIVGYYRVGVVTW